MLEYWLWLSGRRGLGVRGLRALLEQFGTPEAVYCASDAEYPSDIRPDGRTSLADKELASARQILQQCYRQCIHIVTPQDAVYPQRLKNIDDAPLVLYYQGVLPDFDAEPVIAMVGTRRASAYGLLQAKRLGYELGRYGAIVVSGDEGVAKPDPRFIDRALARIDTVDKSRALILGDSLTSDIAAANASGVAGCWFNPHGKRNTTAFTPDYEIRSLKEALEWL